MEIQFYMAARSDSTVELDLAATDSEDDWIWGVILEEPYHRLPSPPPPKNVEQNILEYVSRSVAANIGSPLESALCFFRNHQKAQQICLTNSCKNQHKANSKGGPMIAVTDCKKGTPFLS